jgi:hypothetical protein
MVTTQGSLALLRDPVAEDLLHSRHLARLAYTWTDGTPRVIPIWFLWNGEELVLASPQKAPKIAALTTGAPVALTIDTEEFPYKVLMLRGTIRAEGSHGPIPEEEAIATRYLGEEAGQAFMAGYVAGISQWVRLTIRPEWAGLLDFDTRVPSAATKG